VVVPTRRSTAEAIQILVSHALGDAGSPYLIGIVSDALRAALPAPATCATAVGSVITAHGHTICEYTVDYYGMQYSMFINNLVEILGGLFFIVTAVYILRDKRKCDRYIAGEKKRIV